MTSRAAKICVPVSVERISDLNSALARASEVADIVELRLDYLPEEELARAGPGISAALADRRRPVIITLRPAEFGGARDISIERRLAFRSDEVWPRTGNEGSADFRDIELDLALLLQQREANDLSEMGDGDWDRTICSYHDFTGVPSNLEEIYERMAATPARILKVAVQASDASDCLPIFRLLKRARTEGRELIAITMGEAGIATRILGPARGSFLTYGSLDDESATAPGQLTARDLRELYRIDSIDQQTKIFGIIGKPVSHSLSPRIHNAAFAAAQENAVYIPFEVSDVMQFARRMAHPQTRELDWNLQGLSVTAPHKLTVMSCLDRIDPTAKEIGAVNTIVVRGDELHGYNTDAEGFIAPLRVKFGDLKNARCAMIGGGGGARAALWALRNEAAKVALFVRDVAATKPLAEEFDVDCSSLGSANFAEFDIIINATPLGTQGEQEGETPATTEQLRGVRLAYDLVYNPLETRFLREARAAGCATLSGIEMLLAQAREQFKLWMGREPNSDVMRSAALGALPKNYQ